MKKYIIYSLVLLGSASVLSSCKNEVDDIFDASPADRLIQAAEDTKKILSDAPNGWAMQYFTNEKESGYTYLCRFDSHGAVKMAAENYWMGGEYKEEVSTYDMISDNGPVLSFSSYNTIFHVFADPADIPETPETITNEQGYGHYGDYEFVLMDVKPERIVLKGKKWKKTAILTPLPEGQDWKEYIEAVDAKQASLFSSKIPVFNLNTEAGAFRLTHPSGGYFYICPADGDPVVDTQYMPYVCSLEGMRLMDPFDGRVDSSEDLGLQNFAENAEGLVCTDEGKTATVTAPSATELLASAYDIMTLVDDADNRIQKPVMSKQGASFQIATDQVPASLKSVFDAMNAAVIAYAKKQGASNQYVRYFTWQPVYNAEAGKTQVNVGFRTGRFTIRGVADVTLADGKVSATFLNEGVDRNSSSFFSNVPEIKAFFDAMMAQPLDGQLDAPLAATKAVITIAGSPVDFVLQ